LFGNRALYLWERNLEYHSSFSVKRGAFNFSIKDVQKIEASVTETAAEINFYIGCPLKSFNGIAK
jgi:hypothetical protein